MIPELAHRLLTRDEERALAQRVERGDASAKNEFILSNLRLVRSLIPSYRGHGLDDDDLLQEGVVGLIRAVEKFDYRKGFKFSTYALPWIRQAMRRATADQGKTIRIPVHVAERQSNIARVAQTIESQRGQKATLEELAEATGLSQRHVASALAAPHASASLNQRIGEDETELGDFIADTRSSDPAEQIQLREELRSALETAAATPVSADVWLSVFESDHHSGALDAASARIERNAQGRRRRGAVPRGIPYGRRHSITCALCGKTEQPPAGKVFFSDGNGRSSGYTHYAHVGACCREAVVARFERRAKRGAA